MRPSTSARTVPGLLVVALLTGCAGAGAPRAVPVPPQDVATTPPAQGDLTSAQLSAMLLQASDLPDLTSRRPYASADLTTQGVPQLALCRAPQPDAPHQVANVLAQSGRTGQANVFEVLSVYADETGAQAAYDRAVAAATGCSTYELQGTPYAVEELGPVDVPAPAVGTHYRLTTPGVVSGDVRTLVRSGRVLLLVTGYGAAPDGQSLLQFQAQVARTALGRLAPAA